MTTKRTFNDCLTIWESIKGRNLRSIRRGAEIAILEIDYDSKRVVVHGRTGRRSRSFQELERVWHALTQRRAVHVDSVLSGSGSSRNQPETLFANLPFVEWLEIDGKKHLVLMEVNSHDAGTLQSVDPATAALIRSHALADLAPNGVEIVLPVQDIKQVATMLNGLTGTQGTADGQGEYVYQLGPIAVRVVRETMVDEPFRGRSIIRARGLNSIAEEQSTSVIGRKGKAVDVAAQLVILNEDR